MTSAKRRKLTNPAYNDDRRASVAQALLHLATRVQPDACEGCGHDRSCASRGCNIILTAVELLGIDVSNLDTDVEKVVVDDAKSN